MTIPVALALSFLPVLLWGILGVLSALSPPKDLPALYAAGVLSGLGAVTCAVLSQLGIGLIFPAGPSYSGTPLASIIVAVTEESARTAAIGIAVAFLPIISGVRGDDSADESAYRRGVLWFGLLSGLTFFAFESLWYALRSPESLALRLAWTLPLHGSAGIMAASVFSAGGKRWGGFALAVFFHAAWDFCMEPSRASSSAFLFLSLLSLLGAVFTAFILWNAAPAGDSAPGA